LTSLTDCATLAGDIAGLHLGMRVVGGLDGRLAVLVGQDAYLSRRRVRACQNRTEEVLPGVRDVPSRR